MEVFDSFKKVNDIFIKNVYRNKSFSIEKIPICDRYVLKAHSSGYVTFSKEFDKKEIDNIVLELYTHPHLQINVKTDMGIPVCGAEINLSKIKNMLYTESLKSDDNGIVNVILPQIGTYYIYANHILYDETQREEIFIEKNPNFIDISMKSSGGTVFGCVKTSDDEFIENAKITISRDKHGNIAYESRTNSKGEYIINNILYNNYYISVDGGNDYYKSDKMSDSGIMSDENVRQIRIDKEDPFREENFYLTRNNYIKGTVVNINGNPIDGACIRTEAKGIRDYARHKIANDIISKEDGTFLIPLETRILMFSELILSVIHPQYILNTMTIKDFNWKEDIEEIVITLHESKEKIEGILLDFESKKPIPFCDLFLMVKGANKYSKTSKKTTTSLSGTFTFSNIPEGKYELSAEGYDIQNKYISPKKDIEKDTKIYANKIEKRDTIKISGIVFSIEDKKPIRNAFVICDAKNSPSATTRTNPDGTFNLELLNSKNMQNVVIYSYHNDYEVSPKINVNMDKLDKYEIELIPHQGGIRLTIENMNAELKLRAFLISTVNEFSKEITDLMSGNVIFIKNLNPERSPYIVTVGDQNHIGISDFLNLNAEQNKIIEGKILLVNKTENNQSVYVIDSKSGNPIKNALVEIKGLTTIHYGVPHWFSRRSITNEQGNTTFTELPEYVGTIEIQHGTYKKIQKNVKNECSNSSNEIFVPLDSLIQ